MNTFTSDRITMIPTTHHENRSLRKRKKFAVISLRISAVLSGKETILPEDVKKTIRESAGHHAKDILDKLRELQVDLRSNPAVFIGGGSVLYRDYLEKSPMVASATFVDDPNANALGYQALAEAQMSLVRC